jgi:predicted acetyltransferase
MAFDVHPVTESDLPAYARSIHSAFGEVVDEDALERISGAFRTQGDFLMAISDQGRIVATASAYPLEMTLPSGPEQPFPTTPVPGVTAVGVVPTHRRRGLLTKLMTHQLADFRRRGYPLAVLLASESIIYGRFGYGWAQSYQSLLIESHHDAFRAGVPAPPGRLRLLESDEAGKILPSVHERARRLRPGELNRNARWWERHLKDPEKARGGGGGRLYALHESPDGDADGWVSYRYHRNEGPSGIPRHRAEVDDLVAIDDASRTALWRYVLDLDLVEEVFAPNRPLDEPLRWMLADPRRLRTTELADHLWLRIIDIPSALEARGYGAAERLVVEVASDDPAASGRFVLESGPTSGSCRIAKEGEKGQLALGLADLGAIYLGGIAPSTLAAAGRVTELQPGALATADRVFASSVAPFCTLHF